MHPNKCGVCLIGSLGPDGLVALNSAFLRDGFVVVLPPDTKLDRPLHALFLSGDEDLAVQPANVVISGARSSCSIIEQFVGLADQSYLTNSVTHVVAGEDAEVQHYRVQQESPNAMHIGTVDVTQHDQVDSRPMRSHLGARCRARQ